MPTSSRKHLAFKLNYKMFMLVYSGTSKTVGKTRGVHVLKSKRRKAADLGLIVALSGARSARLWHRKANGDREMEKKTRGMASATPKTGILRCELSHSRIQANRKRNAHF